jgi:hypothetical protein
MIKAHLFWAYGKLSKLEELSLISFVKQGYEVNLWTYGDMPNPPKGVFVKDARDILPENAVFLNIDPLLGCIIIVKFYLLY